MHYEAQELQICGFWTVNVPAVHSFCNDVRDLFPPEESSILAGQLFWMLVYLCFRGVLRGQLGSCACSGFGIARDVVGCATDLALASLRRRDPVAPAVLHCHDALLAATEH